MELFFSSDDELSCWIFLAVECGARYFWHQIVVQDISDIWLWCATSFNSNNRLQPQKVTWHWHWTATCVHQCCHSSWSTVSFFVSQSTCHPCWRPCCRLSTACPSVKPLPRDNRRPYQTSWWPSHSEIFLLFFCIPVCFTCFDYPHQLKCGHLQIM